MSDYSAHERVKRYSLMTIKEVIENISTSPAGLTSEEVEKHRLLYGRNTVSGRRENRISLRLRRAFINPFSSVLLILDIISLFTDIILKPAGEKNITSFAVISVMLIISGTVRMIQELHSKHIADEIIHMVDTPVSVKRGGKWKYIDIQEIVAGDIVRLKAGERVPADIRLTRAVNCFTSMSAITGESSISEKNTDPVPKVPLNLNGYDNSIFMGSTIISGTCEGIVIAVGKDTVYGGFSPDSENRKNSYDKSSGSIALVLIKFMILLVPAVFIASGITKDNWLSAFLFSLSVAIGLTPELLPMVITACLAKGSVSMGRKKTVVKNINAMQSFGSMDVLCVDKTGTLTGDRLIPEYFMDILGNESVIIPDLAYLNSYFQSGVKNNLDSAIMDFHNMPGRREHFAELASDYRKLDELPFDYSRKTACVLLEKNGKKLLISKGDADSILKHCSYVDYGGKIHHIGHDPFSSMHEIIDDILEDGMKVIAVAVKHVSRDTVTPADENDLILMGYVVFLDAPEKSAAEALHMLKELNVNTKVLTGDNSKTAASVCKRLGMDSESILTGDEFDRLSDNEAQITVENTAIFAELSPRQKSRIISVLRSNGHTVGFLGDGVNDIPAVLEADVGISVNNASPSVKEAADVILLKKDLNVLESGIREGRRAFANMSKYIKITASSNLGNIIAIVFASVFLPFFPMTSIQILLLNMLYDILCLVLPWDRVDDDICRKPLRWSGHTLSRFMMYFGPVSSVFDILTFAFLFFFMCPHMCGGSFFSLAPAMQSRFITIFQTGWFIESMWTQILIIHLLRTSGLPFIHSRPAYAVTGVTMAGILVFTVLTVTPPGKAAGLTGLPPVYFLFLIVTVICYLLIMTVVKRVYIRKYNELI